MTCCNKDLHALFLHDFGGGKKKKKIKEKIYFLFRGLPVERRAVDASDRR